MLRALAIATFLATPLAAQEFFTLKGHGGPIMDIAVSYDGRIATASFDNSVGVWNGDAPTWLDGHRAAVNTVAYYSNFLLASGGDDFAVNVWADDGGGAELGRHEAKVTSLDICRETGNLIASGSWDATIAVWDVGPSLGDVMVGIGNYPKRSALEGHDRGVNDIAFSSDCTTLYSASADGTIRVWDVATTSQTHVLVKHGFGVNELELNEEAGWLAYGAVDGGTRIVDLETGDPIADFTLDRRPILAMDFNVVTNQLAVGDGEGFIMVIDTKKREITRDFRATQSGPIWALAFSPAGGSIYAGGIEDILYGWPVETLTEHGQMDGAERSFLEDPKTLPNGERQFKRKCSICHTLTAGSARKAGPSLHRLFGRKAGTVPDYAYSDILDGSEIVWSRETINALFDEGPDHYIPGTKMPMQRIVKQSDRDDLIEYLRTATVQEEN
ncbi:c-type cytochrome [uncultured Litoreibacter sp.]|uniref:c-type cytochrome n=1 Tax=uncultured Litoreibacter sp. TaxID=1392394 RepID=UPI00262C0B81|nr:c-type cytochrome [uncultured Litoreibacter sp.]